MGTLVKPNFDEAIDFAPWKAGWHHVRIEKAGTFVSKEKSTPMIKWHFECVKGDELGRVCTRNTPLAGEGAGFLQRVLESVGVDAEAAAKNGIDLDKLAGKELLIRTEVEKYEGEDRTRVTSFKKIGSPVDLAPASSGAAAGKK